MRSDYRSMSGHRETHYGCSGREAQPRASLPFLPQTVRATGAAMKRLLQHPIAQAALARAPASISAFALRTTRWSLEGHDHMAPHAAGAPVVVAFWHERLPMMPMLWVQGAAVTRGPQHAQPSARAGQPAP